MERKISFKIERVDPLGQGVHLGDEESAQGITFIPRTLPGETGQAHITKSKGAKVSFAKVDTIDQRSDQRIEPSCRHYDACNGCQYLHTNYDYECELKKKSYFHFFKNHFSYEKLNFHAAPKRDSYRNRVQLHYDKSKKQLGFIKDNSIVNVRDCLLPDQKTKEIVHKLYEDDHWRSFVKKEPLTGHIEIYKDEIVANRHYGFGGFSQVNQKMNALVLNEFKRLSTHIHANKDEQNQGFIVDLFGGAGNLSRACSLPTIVLDAIGEQEKMASHQKFFRFDVYDKWADKRMEKLLQKAPYNTGKCLWLIIDPPRSGLKNIEYFIKRFDPKFVTYLSCNPQTQMRDLKSPIFSQYSFEELHFLDFFPSTHHLESLVHLEKRD